VLVVVDHLLRDAENDVCLVAVARCADDFRAGFVIGKKHIEGNGRAQVRLAVLPWDFDVTSSVLPSAVGFLPTKQRPYYVVLLPVLQQERLTAQLAFDVGAELFNEVNRAVCAFLVEIVFS